MTRLPVKILQGANRVMPIEMLLRPPVIPAKGEERPLLCWILPPWQRAEVWSMERKKAFIEGIFLGLGTGFYVVHQPEYHGDGALPMSGWLLDGQQRLSAIRDFVQGDLAIFDGVKYSDLSVGEQRRRFLSVVFPCVELEYQPDEQRLRDLYLRMNFGGMPHTESDLQRLRETPMLDLSIDQDKLSERFIELLVKEIGDESFGEVVRRNADRSHASVCHSHDFCDANMVMAVAWHETVGRHFEFDSESQAAHWSRAWALAVEKMPQHHDRLQAANPLRDSSRSR